MWFTKVSLHNPVFATMVMVALMVLGMFSYQRLKVDQFPNVDFPVVVVTVDYPGASPEIVESEVTRKVEEAVNSIAGINALTSRSYAGTSLVVIEFQLHIEGRQAADDVREKVASVRPLLRDEVEEPRVLRFDPADAPVWSLAVLPTGGAGGQGKAMSAVELTSWADQVLKKRLENVRGVGAVNLVGATPREINLYLDPQALEAFGISVEQVAQAVRSENQDLPVGAVRSLAQERMVQIDARMQRPEDFAEIIVAQRGGSTVRLGQLARVLDGPQEVESLALYNGQRSLLLSVQKAQGDNTIEVVEGLRRAVAGMQAELPPGVRLEPIGDMARPIRVAVDNVRQTLIEGAVLTVLIVFLFLNSWRSTVITGLTLPIALIGTFLFMHWLGFSINMVTLMALSLCVGLLIDDAIVVRENIVRHLQMGKTPYAAAMDGTQEIGLAVLATTLSIVAVFLPIGFMQGIIGKFFHEFGLTIVVAVLISMFVSFTLDPMLSSVWHDPSVHGEARQDRPRSLYERSIGRVTAWFERATDQLAGVYQQILAWALGHRLATAVAALAIFAASVMMVPLLGTEFVPKADFSETTVQFHTPQGSSIEATEAKARQVEAVIRALPEVRYTLTTINTGSARGKTHANIYVRLTDRNQRTRGVEAMAIELRQQLRRIAGITVTQVGLLEPVGGQKQIAFSLQGQDLAELGRLNRQAMELIRDIPGLVDVESSLESDTPRVTLAIKREAASDLGLTTGAVASALRTLLAGQDVGNWRAGNDETYDVQLRLAPEDRLAPLQLARLPLLVTGADGTRRNIRLDQVVEIRESAGPSQINRRALTREVSITANASLRSVGEVSADIREALKGLALAPGYSYQFNGSTKDMDESFGYALSALALAVVFIYMILASQFRSFVQPLALMTALPLTLIGVVLALLMFGSALSMFSMIGVIMLMGLVTKNAILLVDFAIRARMDSVDAATGAVTPGLERGPALLLAARVRLRPILMTTLAMVFGMLPLALAVTEGSEQRAPMGQAVIGGVITSSLLTLVVVPVMYCYMDDLANWARRLAGRTRHKAGPD
ncbi:efflux RND transporter permease subunit [Comamonas endophytica]|uniref:Efflux RND transporter permease subunit n=1 Tax=Comamonas endophytica TaxID=2949090 RepID=A0ABY6G942_9BURK|nr:MULTISPECIES: efflux RND transporter permease subunit [unclassified Acidovorax]MCD2511865.1 efflux RND transporter permease subunit [Acidovorax sp. D4N7]UYG51586.1 efflux RND transporter permease subunit [Acidovorax sp. 5MLIR]